MFPFSDLVVFHTVLVEECQPLQLSSLQNQKHHCYQNLVYALQEHDYESPGEVQMAFILAKHEVRTYRMNKRKKFPSMFFLNVGLFVNHKQISYAHSSLQSVLKQGKDGFSGVCGKVLNSKTGK